MRKKIDELTRLRRAGVHTSDDEIDDFDRQVDELRNQINTPGEFAAYLRFLAADVERSKDGMERSQWMLLMSLADIVDKDLINDEDIADPELIWAALAEAVEGSLD